MDFKFKNVLIALDDSDLSKKAFDRAVHIANRDEATLVLSHVVDTQNFSVIKAYLNDLNDVYEKAEAKAREMLNKYEKIAKDAGVISVKQVIKYGSPKNILVEEVIPEENIDVIVLGATGVSAVERVFLGSVADSAFRHAKCEVLVVR